jgi:acetyltransferase-like isoleucine patch superfamily enzyme
MGKIVRIISHLWVRFVLNVRLEQNSFIALPYMRISGGGKVKIGANTLIGRMAWVSAFNSYLGQKFESEIIIGNHVTIGNYVCITAIKNITIGSGCLFSEYVYISDHAHGFDPLLGSPTDQPLSSKGSVNIGENTFLGYRVSVLPGVSLGKNCVVGAHSVVTHSFPDYSMIVGSPARLLKLFNTTTNLWENVPI